MALNDLSQEMLPALELELERQVRAFDTPGSRPFYEMLTYHMGWSGDPSGFRSGAVSSGGGKATGKRIRPLIVLLSVAGYSSKWLRATPAAAAVELIHNFSLVHDDIEDNSPTRRGRRTLWKMHGVPMAINAGDALFALANHAMLDARDSFPAQAVLAAADALHQACIALTRGQYLDMSYEKQRALTVDDYWPMVEGKTGALLGAAAKIGAILGDASGQAIASLSDFGRNLGLAFQVQDDILGIWGDEQATGKSAASDLVEGKNSLPVLHGLGHSAEFAKRWAAGPITLDETPRLSQLLEDAGSYTYCQQEAVRVTALAMASLQAANPGGDAGAALRELAESLLRRAS